jgi:Magnesium chelatase, subunit ChlI C-terminal/Magnesium chelatase, subunit ChlI
MVTLDYLRWVTKEFDGLALKLVGKPSDDLEPDSITIAAFRSLLSRSLAVAATDYDEALCIRSGEERMTTGRHTAESHENRPYPCGYRSDPRRACTCSPPQVEKYLSRISGPLLDRIDLHVEVPAVPFTQLAEAPPGACSADLLQDVIRARARQADRFGSKGPTVNGRMTPRQVRKFCPLKPESSSLLKGAMEELGLSARAHDKILRVSRTMADLEGTDEIQPNHVAEAVGFRALDRSVWI